MIDSIVNEEFFPDETRSCFFRQDDVRNNQGAVVTDDTDSSSESSGDEEDHDVAKYPSTRLLANGKARRRNVWLLCILDTALEGASMCCTMKVERTSSVGKGSPRLMTGWKSVLTSSTPCAGHASVLSTADDVLV